MSRKSLIWLGALIGGSVGGIIPLLWGEGGLFSFYFIIFQSIGAIFGIWIMFKLTQSY